MPITDWQEVAVDDWQEVPIDDWQEVPVPKLLASHTPRKGVVDRGREVIGNQVASVVAPVSQPTMGRTEQFVRGVKSGLEGVNLGLAQAANWVTGDRLMNPQILDEMERERRAKGDVIKSARGGPKGVGNLGSWGELVGEGIPSIVGGAPATTLRGAIVTGAKLGALSGALAPTVGDESRLANAAAGAAGGAVLAPVIPTIVRGIPTATKKAGELIEKGIERFVTPKMSKGADRVVSKELSKVAPTPPSRYKSPVARMSGEANRIEAAKDVYRLRDYHGEDMPELPQTHQEMLNATTRSMQKVMDWITEWADSVGGAGGRVLPSRVVNELRQVTAENGFGPQRVAQAQALADDFQKRIDAGGYTPSAAMKRLSELNNDVKGIFTGENRSGDSAEILNVARQALKTDLNEMLDSFAKPGTVPDGDPALLAELQRLGLGEKGKTGFGALRSAWGRMNGLEEDILRNVEARASKSAQGGNSVFDILGIQQLIQSVTKGRPELAVTGAGSLATGQTLRWINNPDKHVRKMFRTLDRFEKGAKFEPPVIPRPTPLGPGSAGHIPPTEPATNLETLPGRQSSQMEMVQSARPPGLEEGGMPPAPPAQIIQRPQTVVSAETLPGRQSSQMTPVGDWRARGLEEGGMPPAPQGARIANPEALPPRQSSAMEMLQAGERPTMESGAVPPQSQIGPQVRSGETVPGRQPQYPEMDRTPPRTENNASGQTDVTLEAARKAKADKLAGVKYYRLDTRGGKLYEAIGLRPEDNTINPHEILVRVKDGKIYEGVMTPGEKAIQLTPAAIKQMLKKGGVLK